MKKALVGINAKYIHTNMAIRLLQKNTSYAVDVFEYTIKDDLSKIVNELQTYDIIAFSCYIWNIELVKSIAKKLKDKIIILGGPEVSYNANYYIENKIAQYVIKNEGEEAFDLLLKHLEENIEINLVPNLYHKNGFTFDKYVDLDKIQMAYDLIDDYKNKIIYIETSRGCPYKCAYCMASLDNKVRFFNIEEVKKQLLILINKGGRVFKFLDRTFNANKKYFIELIDFIILNHKNNNSFQFEITGDLLDQAIIQYINKVSPKNLFRFEIGIQSTNINTNLLVNRIQNNEKLFNNIRLIQEGKKIDLHLDLIAGLPKEDYNSFMNTFNEVLSLRPLELQLGFLKILHGTRLESMVDDYDYKYDCNPPYEIISNDSLSTTDINNIHIVEDAFERYYNSGYLRRTMNLILDEVDNYFLFFYNLGLKDKKNGLDGLFKVLDEYLNEININDYNKIYKSLIIDYLSNFKIKPKAWWNKLEKKKANEVLRDYYTNNKKYNLDQLYRYATVIETMDSYIIAIYMNNELEIL